MPVGQTELHRLFAALMVAEVKALGSVSAMARRIGTTEQSVRSWCEGRLPNFDGCALLAGPRFPGRIAFLQLMAGPGVLIDAVASDETAELQQLQRIDADQRRARLVQLATDVMSAGHGALEAVAQCGVGRLTQIERTAVVRSQYERVRESVRRARLVVEVMSERGE